MTDLAVEALTLYVLIPDADKRHVFHVPSGNAEVGYPRAQLRKLTEAARSIAAAGLTEDDFIARALLLHTDVALVAEVGAPVLHVTDGRAVGVDRPPDHWLLMRVLASWIDTDSPRQPDVHLWYRATLAAMTGANTWHARHADAAAAQRPADATLLFLAGCVHENLASTWIQASFHDGDQVLGSFRPGVRSASEELGLAATLLKRALELNPASSRRASTTGASRRSGAVPRRPSANWNAPRPTRGMRPPGTTHSSFSAMRSARSTVLTPPVPPTTAPRTCFRARRPRNSG